MPLHFNFQAVIAITNITRYDLYYRYQAVVSLVEAVETHYPGEQIDWTLVHDAGCTCDDTELPHHVTSRDDIEKLITTSFTGLLSSLPGPPTIITISR